MIVPMAIIHRATGKGTPEQHSEAAKLLSGAAFKLYMYLEERVEDSFIYQRATFQKEVGLHLTTINKVIDELLEKNFLEEKNSGNQGNYNFFSYPSGKNC